MAGRINKQQGKEVLQDQNKKVAAEEATNVPEAVMKAGGKMAEMAAGAFKDHARIAAAETVAPHVKKFTKNKIDKAKKIASNNIKKTRKRDADEEEDEDEETMDEEEDEDEEEEDAAAKKARRKLKKMQDEMPAWRAHLSRAKHWTGDRLNEATGKQTEEQALAAEAGAAPATDAEAGEDEAEPRKKKEELRWWEESTTGEDKSEALAKKAKRRAGNPANGLKRRAARAKDNIGNRANRLKDHVGNKLNEARPHVADGLQNFADRALDGLQEFVEDKVDEAGESDSDDGWGDSDDGWGDSDDDSDDGWGDDDDDDDDDDEESDDDDDVDDELLTKQELKKLEVMGLKAKDCKEAACAVKKKGLKDNIIKKQKTTNTQIVMECFGTVARVKKAMKKYCSSGSGSKAKQFSRF